MSSTLPKISIITINYNDCSGLQKTFDSVFGQTWQDFEYVVIDGGSTDGSKELIEKNKLKIDYWVSEPDSGIYNAMNKGIAAATGAYLLFLNAGDHFYSDTVLEENYQDVFDADLVCFDMERIKQKEIIIEQFPKIINFSYFLEGSIGHPATFIKKELFEKFGFYNEQLKIVSDWEFFMKVLIFGNCSYKKIDKILSTFYAGGISSSDFSPIESSKVLNENYARFIDDYDELFKNRRVVNSNRVQMLIEIEKSSFGKKMISFLFRLYIFCFSKRKLKDILIKVEKTSIH